MKHLFGLILILSGLVAGGVGMLQDSTVVVALGAVLAMWGVVLTWYLERRSLRHHVACRCKTGLHEEEEKPAKGRPVEGS